MHSLPYIYDVVSLSGRTHGLAASLTIVYSSSITPKCTMLRAGCSQVVPSLPNWDAYWRVSAAVCYSQIRYENEKRQECNRLVLARQQKQSVVDTYRTHATDTGSPEVQIALLSERIGQLTDHFKTHLKDHGSRRGLLMMVSRRRRLLDYLKKYDSERYKTVISKTGIRKKTRA